MSEIQLHQGIYTQKELAAWFGFSYGSLRNNKEKYLEELKEYASYELTETGKINILYVKIPIYVKPDSNFEKIKKNIPAYWNKNGLDKKVDVAKRIYSKEELNIKYETTYSYVCKASNQLWGKPSSIEGGETGNCHWVLCARNLETQKLRYFTSDENARALELRRKYLENRTEESKVQKSIRDALRLQFKKKEITEEQYKDGLLELEDSMDVLYSQYFEELGKMLPEGDMLDWGIEVTEYLWKTSKGEFTVPSRLGTKSAAAQS